MAHLSGDVVKHHHEIYLTCRVDHFGAYHMVYRYTIFIPIAVWLGIKYFLVKTTCDPSEMLRTVSGKIRAQQDRCLKVRKFRDLRQSSIFKTIHVYQW